MPKQASTPIKIAAFFLLVGGVLTVFTSLVGLTVGIASTDTQSLRDLAVQMSRVILLALGVANVLSGWFLIKLKNWAYILGIVLTAFSAAIYLLALAKAGATQFPQLFLSLGLLGLLVYGRKDFKSPKL